MKAVVCAPIRIAAIWLAVALLMLASTLPVQAQTNSAGAPSFSGATQSAPSGGEADKPAAHKAAHAKKKKKPSFMKNMHDKAMRKFQKLFGSKQEPKQKPEQEPKVE